MTGVHAPQEPQEETAAGAADSGSPGGARGLGRRVRSGAVAFFASLTVVLALYTLLAFDLAWDTQAGRIGPGFFPRIIGVLGTALALIGLVQSLRAAPPAPSGPSAPTATPTPGGSADGGQTPEQHHPGLILLIALALAGFVTVFIPVGAPVTGALFLLAMALMLDRTRIVRKVVLSAAFPVLLYLVFDVWLQAGLPAGILPFL